MFAVMINGTRTLTSIDFEELNGTNERSMLYMVIITLCFYVSNQRVLHTHHVGIQAVFWLGLAHLLYYDEELRLRDHYLLETISMVVFTVVWGIFYVQREKQKKCMNTPKLEDTDLRVDHMLSQIQIVPKNFEKQNCG
jgi:uncharacterized protein YneF (UPF0154 family)